jgi:hypothetical protein
VVSLAPLRLLPAAQLPGVLSSTPQSLQQLPIMGLVSKMDQYILV